MHNYKQDYLASLDDPLKLLPTAREESHKYLQGFESPASTFGDPLS